jgi:uncharacterized protein YcfL
MKKYLFIIVAALISLCSCSQDENANKNLRTNIKLSSESNIEVHVDIASELNNAITIVSANGKKPGAVNAVEAVIMVKNETDSEKRISTTGKWYDSRGNNYGGHGGELVLAPYQTEALNAGTQSKNVTTYSLSITTSSKTEHNYITDAVLSSSQKIAEGNGLTYSETASDEIIPTLPIGGLPMANRFRVGQLSSLKTERGTGAWMSVISSLTF